MSLYRVGMNNLRSRDEEKHRAVSSPAEIGWIPITIKKAVLLSDNRCLFPLKTNRYVPLSDCNRILIIPSQFPDIPPKISEYLRTKSPSGANTRIMRGFYNILNTNDLCLRRISSLCEKAHFVMQNGLYRTLIWALSHCEMGHIRTRNGLFLTMIWGISKYYIVRNALHSVQFNIPLHLFRENILSK